MVTESNPYRSSSSAPLPPPPVPVDPRWRPLGLVCYLVAFLASAGATMTAMALPVRLGEGGWDDSAVGCAAAVLFLGPLAAFSAAFGSRLRHGRRRARSSEMVNPEEV